MRHTRGYRTGRPAAYFALHQTGFFVPPTLPSARWALTPPFHPFSPVFRFSAFAVFRFSDQWFIFCDTIRRRGIDPQRLHLPFSSCSVLPYGVRTFLSKFIRTRLLTGPWDQRTWSDGQAPKLRKTIVPECLAKASAALSFPIDDPTALVARREFCRRILCARSRLGFA